MTAAAPSRTWELEVKPEGILNSLGRAGEHPCRYLTHEAILQRRKLRSSKRERVKNDGEFLVSIPFAL